MKLFKKNENKKTTKLPMTGKVKKGLPLLLYGSNGIDPCCGNIRDRFCGE